MVASTTPQRARYPHNRQAEQKGQRRFRCQNQLQLLVRRGKEKYNSVVTTFLKWCSCGSNSYAGYKVTAVRLKLLKLRQMPRPTVSIFGRASSEPRALIPAFHRGGCAAVQDPLSPTVYSLAAWTARWYIFHDFRSNFDRFEG